MNVGKILGLTLVAAAVIGAIPSPVNAAERVVLGEYFSQLA